MANFFTRWYYSRSGCRLAKLRELHPMVPRIELAENGSVVITLVDNERFPGNMQIHFDQVTAKAFVITLTNKLVEGVTKNQINNEQGITEDRTGNNRSDFLQGGV